MEPTKVENAPKVDDKSWLIFDRMFKPTKKIFIRVAIAKELWYQTLSKNGAKLYKVLCIDIEQDKDDPTLKLYNLTILGLIINLGWI